jgi:hypothetical protein
MQIGMIGLGRMGANMVRRLLKGGHECVVFYLEEAWRIVEPVLKTNAPAYEYEPGTWGPTEVNQRIVPADGWNNPVIKAPTKAPSSVGTEVHAA